MEACSGTKPAATASLERRGPGISGKQHTTARVWGPLLSRGHHLGPGLVSAHVHCAEKRQAPVTPYHVIPVTSASMSLMIETFLGSKVGAYVRPAETAYYRGSLVERMSKPIGSAGGATDQTCGKSAKLKTRAADPLKSGGFRFGQLDEGWPMHLLRVHGRDLATTVPKLH